MEEKRCKSGGSHRRGGEPKDDRTVLLCFEASREGFLWLSRYVCFPFLLVVKFTALATTWHYVLIPWRIFDDTMLLLLVAGLHALGILVLWLLFKTNRTPPGYVPLSWEPPSDLLESGKFVDPTSRDFSSTYWCSKCQSYRPKRAHHCRYCQRCVLVFDHHCPWVNNCVGWANVKYFMLLLFYATAFSGLICLAFFVRCWQVIWFSPESATVTTKLILVGLLATWISFGFGILTLAQAMMVQIVYLTPSCEKMYVRTRIQQTLKMPREERVSFLRGNISLVFGRPALWYVPTPPSSDPYRYPSFTDTFLADEPENQENRLMDDLAQMEQERKGIEALLQYRADTIEPTSSDDEDGRREEWKAKEESSNFDPALFYGQLRKGG